MEKKAQLFIEDFSPKGYGIGLYEGRKEVEVAHTVVGDEVIVSLQKRKQKGRLLEILTPSKDRVTPRCSHAAICGGCSWQQIDYPAQLQAKEKVIQKAFASFSNIEIYPIIPCPFPWQYRNKMEFSFSENRAKTKFLGLMIAQANSFVFNVTACHLCPNWFSKVLNAVRAWWENSELTAYHPLDNIGTLRNLTIREAVHTKQKMVILTVSADPNYALSKNNIETFKETILSCFPKEEEGNLSVFLRLQQVGKGITTQFYEMHLLGREHILEKMHLELKKPVTLSFLISPTSFFQPNTKQAEKLYQTALNLCDLPDQATVFDLYCGTGTLGIAIAPMAKKVISIELNPYAVYDAKQNAKINNIENIEFYAGDVADVLAKLKEEKEFVFPHLVIVDPPRAGLDAKALEQVLFLKPKTILYISCNPLTQARDSKSLIENGYQLEKLQPIDQFPHTVHIENIAIFKR